MPAILLIALLAVAGGLRPAAAVSPFAGSHITVSVLAVDTQDPIFTKAFTEGEGVLPFAGDGELYLPARSGSAGLRLAYERLNRKCAGLGVALSLWRARFRDTAFHYDSDGAQRRIVRYRDPQQVYGILDLTGTYLPWTSRQRALGLSLMLSAAGSYEDVRLERYGAIDPDDRLDLTRESQQELSLRFGVGLGLQVHLTRRLSVAAEARWIAGERYPVEESLEVDGTVSGGGHERLYTLVRALRLGFRM